jgi:hypothetical protein
MIAFAALPRELGGYVQFQRFRQHFLFFFKHGRRYELPSCAKFWGPTKGSSLGLSIVNEFPL